MPTAGAAGYLPSAHLGAVHLRRDAQALLPDPLLAGARTRLAVDYWRRGASARLFECAALEQSAQLKSDRDWLMRFRAEGRFPSLRKLAVGLLRDFGVHPVAVERVFEGTGKGDWIAQIRSFTGQAPALAPGEVLHIGTNAAEPYLGSGWHRGEGIGRWTANRTAEILFSVGLGPSED